MSNQPARPEPGRLRERTAEEIRVILARKRMSAAELARRTQLKQAYVSRRMTGEIAFDLDDLEVIARELGVTVAELLGDGSQTTVADLAAADHLLGTLPNGRLPTSRTIPSMRRPARIEQTSGAREQAA